MLARGAVSLWFVEQKVSMGSPWGVCGERMARGHLTSVAGVMLKMGMRLLRGHAVWWPDACGEELCT